MPPEEAPLVPEAVAERKRRGLADGSMEKAASGRCTVAEGPRMSEARPRGPNLEIPGGASGRLAPAP